MFKASRLLMLPLFMCVVAGGPAGATELPPAEKDPLRATLLESKEKNRGVTIHANGASIGCVVISVDERYVIGRSQTASRVVVRLDRIDGVSAMF